MRKSLLAMAALMGVATLPAHAWRVKVDEETFANIGFSTIIRGTYEGKRTNTEKSRINFSVPLFNITASGQVNKLVYFSMNLEGSRAIKDKYCVEVDTTEDGLQCVTYDERTVEHFGVRVRDAFIGMKFADELRVQAGLQRVPFSRAALTSTYALLVPTSYAKQGLGVNPLSVQTNVDVSPRDAGVVVWGNVAEGMLKYYLAVTDGATIGSSTDDSLAYTVRLQFTPTMLGFKGETGYTVSDTYLGKQNVLSIGAGYRVVGRRGSKDTKMWTVDALYEQKFGDIVPNLQVGYISVKDAGGSTDDASHIYAQGQLLYDQVVGFGKPALAVKFEQNKNKVNGPDPKNTRVGIWAHYYIKGQAAKVSLGVDSVNLNSAAKANVPSDASYRNKNFTDVHLQFQVQF